MRADAATVYKPAIEWAPPVINDVPGALEDLSCLIERLRALLLHNIDEMQEAVVDRPCANDFQTKWINDVWMIFRLGAEKLDEVDTVVSALVEASVGMPISPVARHTQIRRSRDWRRAVDAWKAEEASSDTSDEAILRAGEAFNAAMGRRVSNLDEFREKMELLQSSKALPGPFTDELFRDLDALGCRAQRAVAA